MFLGLRLLDGLDVAEASKRLSIDLGERYRPQIEELLGLGLLGTGGYGNPAASVGLSDCQPGIYAVFGLMRPGPISRGTSFYCGPTFPTKFSHCQLAKFLHNL